MWCVICICFREICQHLQSTWKKKTLEHDSFSDWFEVTEKIEKEPLKKIWWNLSRTIFMKIWICVRKDSLQWVNSANADRNVGKREIQFYWINSAVLWAGLPNVKIWGTQWSSSSSPWLTSLTSMLSPKDTLMTLMLMMRNLLKKV